MSRNAKKWTYSLALITLSACGGGGSVTEPTPEPPTVVVDFAVASVDLEALTGESGTSTLSISNDGDESITFLLGANNNPAWLTLTPAAGTIASKQSMDVEVAWSCEANVTNYMTELDVTVNSVSQDKLTVTLNCKAPPAPTFGDIAPLQISLETMFGGSATQSFAFRNVGDADLTWTASTADAVVRLSVPSGTAAPNEQVIIGVEGMCGTTEETRTTVITVDTNDANRPQQEVNFALSCVAPLLPLLSIDREPLAAPVTDLFQGDTKLDFAIISNTGPGMLDYELRTSDANVISIEGRASGLLQSGEQRRFDLRLHCGANDRNRNVRLRLITNDPITDDISVDLRFTCQVPVVPRVSVPVPASISAAALLNMDILASFLITNVGGADLRYSVAVPNTFTSLQNAPAGTLAPTTSERFTLNLSCGALEEVFSGDVVISSNDPSRPEVTIPVSLSCGGSNNLKISRVSFNQAVPNLDTDSSGNNGDQPLIAERGALLRVFAEALISETATVRATYRVSGGPIETVDFTMTPRAVPTSTDEAVLATTFNFLVPASEMVEGLEFFIEIDPDNVVNEIDETDNRWPTTGFQDLDVQRLPPLKVRFVRIDLGNGLLTDDVDIDVYIKNTLERLPIGATQLDVRDQVYTNTMVGADSCALLQPLDELRFLDGVENDNIYYYGIMKTDTNGGGFVGCGYVPGYAAASFGLDELRQEYASDVVAHELGHNFNLRHAPCGGPSGPDPDYPYANAVIGHYGYNLMTGDFYSPQVVDVMAYCDPSWISDYNFDRARRQLQRAAQLSQSTASASVASESYLVSGTLAGDKLTLGAFVPMQRPASLPSPGEYELVAYDHNGTVVHRVSFKMNEHSHADSKSFAFSIPDDGTSLARVDISRQDVRIATKLAMTTRPNSERSKAMLEPVAAQRVSDSRIEVIWDSDRFQMAVISTANGVALARDDSGSIVVTSDVDELSVLLIRGFEHDTYRVSVDNAKTAQR